MSKLEEASFSAPTDDDGWSGGDQLKAAQERLVELTKRWNAGAVTNDLFFKLLGELEQQIAGLRAEASKREAAARLRRSRAGTDVAEIRRRWNLPEEMGGLPISTKRTYIREALHAVIVHPAGKGRKTFDPDLLELIWQED